MTIRYRILKVVGLVLRYYFGLNVRGWENIPPRNGQGLIVAVSHRHWSDPLLVISIVGWVRGISTTKAISGRRLAESLRFHGYGLLSRPLAEACAWVVRGLGAYHFEMEDRPEKESHNRQLGDKVVDGLKQGGTLVIFPEKVKRLNPSDKKVYEAAPGVARFARLADCLILPIRIDWQRKKIVIGKMIRHNGSDDKEVAKLVVRRIYQL